MNIKSIIEKQNEYKGYKYLVLGLYPMGHRCGYVQIPDSNYLYKKSYSDNLKKISFNVLDGEPIGKREIISLFCSDGETVTMDILFNVHGGVTFSGELNGQEGWWIGFDCAHAGDARDPDLMDEKTKKFSFSFSDGIIRTTDYVEKECKNLIDQIIKYFYQEENKQ